jgi:putative tRNA adenosine deaminase-associated protein
VVNRLELPLPDEDEDALQPAGDMQILSDLGFSAMDLAVLCDEEELYPDEMLEDMAGRVGFGTEFQSALEAVSS